jgi:hypothetical protein
LNLLDKIILAEIFFAKMIKTSIILLITILILQINTQSCVNKCNDMTCGIDIGLSFYTNFTFCNCTFSDLNGRFTECDNNNQKTLFYYWKPPAICTGGRLPPPVTNIPCNFSCNDGGKINFKIFFRIF